MNAGNVTIAFLLISIFCFSTKKAVAQNGQLDSTIKVFTHAGNDEEKYISTAFSVADQYMDLEQYDSAQNWLSKIHDKVPAKKASLFNYFLVSRQAEIYYYNNLQQLGLQESFRGLQIAQDLNDSLLLMDSYNFLGLFYMNLDSSNKAVYYFRKGIGYINKPTHPEKYISLSKPHHLFGNLSEAYYKRKEFDSALYYIRASLNSAYNASLQRGIAVGHTGAGDIFFETGKLDSALVNYMRAKSTAKESEDIDIELLSYSGLAKVYNKNKQHQQSNAELDSGFLFLKHHPNLNRYFALQFLNAAISVYKDNGENAKLVTALELKSEIERENLKNNNSQLQAILNAGLANEKSLLNLEVKDAQRKQVLANSRLLVALAGIALLLIVFLVYRYYQNQRLEVSRIRQKISQDLHDDIGASLSSLQIYAAVAEESLQPNPGKAREMMVKIKLQSKDILETMGDIVWSMKSNSTGSTTLEMKVKNYATELLEDRQIEFTCIIQPDADDALSSMKARRNIFMIIREVLNNTVKYSEASQATLHIFLQDKNWVMDIADNGTGLKNTKNNSGNGLKNIKVRTEELKGAVTINSERGTRFLFIFPVTVISDTGW